MRNLVWILILLIGPLFSHAQHWEIEGEIDILTRLGSKPTSEQGQLSFVLPSLKLAGEYSLNQQSSVFLQVQLAETRSTETKKQMLELTRAFYEWISDDDSWIVRYGLIKNTYLDTNENLLDYDLVPEFKAFANRYNYLPSTDLGVEFHYVPTDYLDISLGVFNGEENTKKEDGAQKDVYLTLSYDDPQFHISGLSIRGAYDEYEKPYNIKERDLVRIVLKGSVIELGIEGLRSKELSNATVAYNRAELWDGTMYPEVVVTGEGVSGWLLLKIDSELEFLARKDYLDPFKDVKLDEIESEGVAMIIKDKLRSLLFGYSKTLYKDLHSTQSPEREFGFVGLRQIF